MLREINVSQRLLVRRFVDRRKTVQKNMEKAKNANSAKAELKDYLTDKYLEGVQLFVDGEAVLPEEAASRAVREDCVYMADYVLGKTGSIEQIRFDKLDRL
jgi:hypothetical protein